MSLDSLGIDPHWWWLIIAAVLGIAELLVPGVFLIWLAAAAAVTGLIAMATGITLAFQFGLFALISLGAVYWGRRWYASHPVESSDPLLNDRAARLIGETVIVVGAIENGSGRVKVGDSVWNARGPDAEIGARVRIVGADGTCLRVEHVAIPHSPAIG
jgi:membrane protein implicated in regulation of membrane protease activity